MAALPWPRAVGYEWRGLDIDVNFKSKDRRSEWVHVP